MKIKKYIAKTFQEGKLLILEELGDDAIILSSRTTPIDANGETNIEIIAGINETDDSNSDSENSNDSDLNTNASSISSNLSNNISSNQSSLTKQTDNLNKQDKQRANRLLDNYNRENNRENQTSDIVKENKLPLDKNKGDLLSKLENLAKPLSNIINKIEESAKDSQSQYLKNQQSSQTSSLSSKIDNEDSREYYINSKIEESYKNNKISSIDLSFITSTNSDLSEIKKSIKNIENIERYKNSNLLSSTHQKLYNELLDADFSSYYSMELLGIATQNLYRNIQTHIKNMIFESVSNAQKENALKDNKTNESKKVEINNLNIFAQVNDYNLLKREIIEQFKDSLSFGNLIQQTNQQANQQSKKQQRIIFVGPSGSGKTSALIKLAIVTKLMYNSKILIISADSYKVGGIEQLQTLSSIAAITFKSAFTNVELQKILIEAKDYEFVFIDTAGKSPKDDLYLKEISDFIKVAIPTTTYLVQNATVNIKTFNKVLENFKIFNPTSIILSKIDETESIGSIISAIKDKNYRLSYVTNGQQIPDDIEPANLNIILSKIFK